MLRSVVFGVYRLKFGVQDLGMDGKSTPLGWNLLSTTVTNCAYYCPSLGEQKFDQYPVNRPESSSPVHAAIILSVLAGLKARHAPNLLRTCFTPGLATIDQGPYKVPALPGGRWGRLGEGLDAEDA